MTAEVVQLTEELRGVRHDLQRVLSRLDWMDEQTKTERRRSRLHRLGSGVVALIVVAVLFLGWRDVQERDRAEHRECIAANQTRADIRQSIVDTVLVIVERTDDPAQLEPLVEQIEARLERSIPDRVC